MTRQKATQSLDAPEKPQIDRFRDTARQLGCDEDEAAFEEKLRGIAVRKSEVNSTAPKTEKPHNG